MPLNLFIMTQKMDNENFENKTSLLKPQNSTPIPKTTQEETKLNTVLKPEVEEKKSFTERLETSRFWLVRGTYQVIRTVWMVVMVIGGFIAWLIAMLFI